MITSLLSEFIVQIHFVCHSEERSDEESQITEQILDTKPRFFAPYSAQNDMTLRCVQTLAMLKSQKIMIH